MTTTTVNYQAIVTAATDGELSLGIVYNDRPEVRDMAMTELHRRALRENTARDRAARKIAFRQAVNHVADLIRKHQLDGEDIHTLTCAIDYDGATTPETYWGEELTDTFAYLVNYCTVLEESAETLFAEVGLVLGW
jgi:hypothetical protein